MQLKALGYELSLEKENTIKAIRRAKIKEYELSSMKQLIAAEMTLELQYKLQELQTVHNRTEAEIKGIESAIEFETKSVQNWKAQLEVIKSWK